MPLRQSAVLLIVLPLLLASCRSSPSVDTYAEANQIRQLDSLWQEAMNAKTKSAGTRKRKRNPRQREMFED